MMRRGLTVLLLVAAALPGCVARDEAHVARGKALFEGDAALTARLATHEQPLPSQATRCINCHGAATDEPAQARAAAAAGWAAPLARTAPLLDRTSLKEARSRRGGPPSAYDATALCRLLRTGVDPAHVLLPTVMPRYDISDAQCAELWSYLYRR